ncbi:patatin [Rhizobium sp. YIM 134829]|uniref:patatin n=1 Tax=Rhizobium sp. YIM 134829 TaxID=3390453 RepID=UPI00397B38C5
MGGAAAGDAGETALPTYSRASFILDPAQDCDMIMQGGITSGLVYPFAILKIATRYRFRSIGGTSAGAIAAAFAAAAEYGRQSGRPEAFVTLQDYARDLPNCLSTLFQPSPDVAPAAKQLASFILPAKSSTGLVARLRSWKWLPLLLLALVGLIIGGLGAWYLLNLSGANRSGAVLGAVMGGLLGLLLTPIGWLGWRMGWPLYRAFKRLPATHFGFCTGKTQPGSTAPALTDWIHRALQHIAFGDPNHPTPLTFGDLRQVGADPIRLQMVTTNLSMRRPHTLPALGLKARFLRSEWRALFPHHVLDFMIGKVGEPDGEDRFSFPDEDALPVVVAVRMSLSYPLLFTAVPLEMEDSQPAAPEAAAVQADHPAPLRKALFSDGGISSNFPIHLFDAPLPSRPTFALSLGRLAATSNATQRAVLQTGKVEGTGVPVEEIQSLKQFGWQILGAATDWQDQLLSELEGQRDRIARIYLKDGEGGLNLSMGSAQSEALMGFGAQAGELFTSSNFSFDEHRWHRLLSLYKTLDAYLNALSLKWHGGFDQWQAGKLTAVGASSPLTTTDRAKIINDLRSLIGRAEANALISTSIPDAKFPDHLGKMRIGPDS